MDIEVASVIDLADLQLMVVQRLEGEDNRARYRVETSQREQFLLQVYSEENWAEFEHERLCLTHLGPHENLLSLSHAAIVPGPPKTGLLLYDSMPIGSLARLSAQVEDLSEQQVLNYAKEIAKGLAFIHGKGVVHCDLRMESVWVGSDFRCKIAGFECAFDQKGDRQVKPSDKANSPHAPESANSPSPRPSLDIWAFGCLIYRLLYREPPFDQSPLPPDQTIAEWKPQTKPVSPDWDYLFSRVFMVDPNGRAGSREIIDTLSSFKLEKRINFPLLSVPLPAEAAAPQKRKLSWMGNSTKSWVQSATSEDPQPPDVECMRKLISKAWNKPQKIGKFFHSYQKLTYSRTIVAIKALMVLHGYVMQGPIALVTVHGEAVRRIIDRCEVVWTPSVRMTPDEYYTEYLAGLIRQFLKLLQRKLELHTASHSMGSWQNSDLGSLPLCIQALSYWSDSLLLASRLFVGGKDLLDLRLSWMVQVLEDVLGLYTSLCCSLPAVLEILEEVSMRAVLVLKFQSCFNKLGSLVKGLHRQRPGLKMMDLPEKHPEEIQRLMAAVPAGAESVDVFLSENELPATGLYRSSTVQYTTLKAISFDTSSRARAATVGTEDIRRPSPIPKPRPEIAEIPERSEDEPESPQGMDQRLRGLMAESPPWLILMDELQFKEVMSMGIYFTVYKGIYRHTSVAISVLRSFVQKPNFSSMVDYISLMSRVTHPNLVLFMGASVGRQIAIVTELCEGRSLYEWLHERRDWELKMETAFGILADIARAMHALHSHLPPLPHGELASSKVLLMDEFSPQSLHITAKLSEFGIRMFLDPNSGGSQLGYWTAPEVGEGGEISERSDVYSFGVLMLEILLRKVPSEADIREKPVSKLLPANVSNLLIQCLERSPALRPTSQMVLDVFDSLPQ